MSIFDVTYSQVWESLTPPVLRQPRQLTWGTALLKPLQYLHDLVFGDYVNGSTYNMYDNTSAYTLSDRVVYFDRGVYENISGCTGINCTNDGFWRKINDNYIGANERVKYNSQKILFEYALNKWFQCSGIYIQTLTGSTNCFLLGETGGYSSSMPSSSVYSQDYLTQNYNGSNLYDYCIYVPLSVYNALANTNQERENIIRSIADDYNLAGMMYSVSGY